MNVDAYLRGRIRREMKVRAAGFGNLFEQLRERDLCRCSAVLLFVVHRGRIWAGIWTAGPASVSVIILPTSNRRAAGDALAFEAN